MYSRRDFLAGGIAAAGGVLLTGQTSQARQLSTNDVFYDKDAPVLGNPKGKVTVVEFFDYQCPYCKSSHAMVKKVVAADGDVRLVMKDWPVFGGASIFAAQAVLGAAQIGKYQVAMDALMKTKARLSEEDVEKALTGVGLTMKEIAASVNKHNKKISGILDRNYNQALSFNFVGTPSFVIGKTIYPGVLDEKGLKEAIRNARA
ncbi:DsbA family protein (plasmid) [Agrobacterium radiobacter]|jgi:protein-disulfide isomerase|uniref:Disulfide bonded thioredoxin protein n=1 Tax=Agrobacterium tumefaciens str. B6 TaxID=1183423 RepID=A0A822VAY6_AGRTU|nr:DsbA family protein [Agrobacterium tumefaciens]KWT81308.1 disulfide bond formation protein DsbA [Agrobacterium tumefaciens str. B6]MQB27530.1 DsbA family protein [Agrobacterium tumefaciens]NTA05968.1 DsbA family protein [Agrobacterium tumefaciens]NTA94965.1 DsbA family protein [Agrobacterium tumefaciens]NTB13614.1 DsbA family protein [Agrobacterium tumefaciens]